MAEETTNIESGGSDASAMGADPAAVALGLGSASRGEADAFLRKQSSLIDEQKHHLRAQFRQLGWSLWEVRLGVLLRAATAAVGIAVASAVAFMVWDASQSNGLVIEAFSVPADLAARGLSGQVVAAKLLDRLVDLRVATDSQRDLKTYGNDWGDDIKIEIPETGISIGELERYLRETLGHSIHISGEIIHTASGLALTVRVGTEGSATANGSDGDLVPLIQSSAESVYKLTEPYRYIIYLYGSGRNAEAITHEAALAQHGPAGERAWGYLVWAPQLGFDHGVDASIAAFRTSLKLMPNLFAARANVAELEDLQSRPSASIRDMQLALQDLAAPDHGGERADLVPISKTRTDAYIATELGDFEKATALWRDVVDFGPQGSPNLLQIMLARAELGEHDVAAARAAMADLSSGMYDNLPRHQIDQVWGRIQMDGAAENWLAVLADERAYAPLVAQYPGLRTYGLTRSTPWLAYADAKLGDWKAAEALIATTPDHCDLCLRMRARLAALQGQSARADWWFARAIFEEPASPFAYAEWGQSLLERGDADGAIAKFKLANQKGPHFADPLEGWGEALMAQNRSDLAVAKFAQANTYAPNWGRLHLKWGEALSYAGKKTDAQKQFARAATLDLAAAEKAGLKKVTP